MKLWMKVLAAALAALYGIARTIHDAFFDGQPGIQNAKQILGGMIVGSWISSFRAMMDLFVLLLP